MMALVSNQKQLMAFQRVHSQEGRTIMVGRDPEEEGAEHKTGVDSSVVVRETSGAKLSCQDSTIQRWKEVRYTQ